jgi:hypothetical protein
MLSACYADSRSHALRIRICDSAVATRGTSQTLDVLFNRYATGFLGGSWARLTARPPSHEGHEVRDEVGAVEHLPTCSPKRRCAGVWQSVQHVTSPHDHAGRGRCPGLVDEAALGMAQMTRSAGWLPRAGPDLTHSPLRGALSDHGPTSARLASRQRPVPNARRAGHPDRNAGGCHGAR